MFKVLELSGLFVCLGKIVKILSACGDRRNCWVVVCCRGGGGGISTQADTIIMDCLSNHLTPNICAVNRILELNICSQSSFVYGQNDKIRWWDTGYQERNNIEKWNIKQGLEICQQHQLTILVSKKSLLMSAHSFHWWEIFSEVLFPVKRFKC